MKQDVADEEFPFLWLDPEYCWHSGFVWWEGKLRDAAWVIARQKFGGRYLDALRDLSRRVAHIQLVPYHSASFRAHALIRALTSSATARKYVLDTLLPAAAAATKTLIVARSAGFWNLPEGVPNIVLYERSQRRNASFGPQSPGGKAILERYGIL